MLWKGALDDWRGTPSESGNGLKSFEFFFNCDGKPSKVINYSHFISNWTK